MGRGEFIGRSTRHFRPVGCLGQCISRRLRFHIHPIFRLHGQHLQRHRIVPGGPCGGRIRLLTHRLPTAKFPKPRPQHRERNHHHQPIDIGLGRSGLGALASAPDRPIRLVAHTNFHCRIGIARSGNQAIASFQNFDAGRLQWQPSPIALLLQQKLAILHRQRAPQGEDLAARATPKASTVDWNS